jgi:hypothetical protein
MVQKAITYNLSTGPHVDEFFDNWQVFWWVFWRIFLTNIDEFFDLLSLLQALGSEYLGACLFCSDNHAFKAWLSEHKIASYAMS